MPTTSIIITTYNRPALVPRAIASAKAAGTDVEVIVVDDGSQDQTAEVCSATQGIRYIRVDRNQGVAGARNIGILVSHGEFLSFLDDDDMRIEGSLDLQVAELRSAPSIGMVYGRALVSDLTGNPTGKSYPHRCPQGDVFWELLCQNFVPCGSAVVRRSCVLRSGLLDPSIPGIDDWDLWVRMAELFPIAALERPVMIWRKSTPTSGQGSSRADTMVEMSTRQFRQRWLKLARAAGGRPEERRNAWRRFSRNMASHLAFESTRAFGSGQLRSAFRNLRTAVRLHPIGCLRAAPGAFSFRSS